MPGVSEKFSMLLVGSVLAGFVAFSKKSRKGESNFITGEEIPFF